MIAVTVGPAVRCAEHEWCPFALHGPGRVAVRCMHCFEERDDPDDTRVLRLLALHRAEVVDGRACWCSGRPGD